MHTVDVRNVSDALWVALQDLQNMGAKRDSRNGPVLLFSGPVMTQYRNPDERVIFYPERDANPYFHFMEALWMLAGRNDVEFPSRFASNIANYSDDGVTFHGAYGHRWRHHFQTDQIETAIRLLKANPDDRRVVIDMWDSGVDLDMEGKDFPCNLLILPRINPYGKLDMTVVNRSNDIIWGAYGANAVHMSMLMEYMAAGIGVPLGTYYQFSTNFHGYEATLEKHSGLLTMEKPENPYVDPDVSPFPMVKDFDTFNSELSMFMDEGERAVGYTEPLFKRVAGPMMLSWNAWKNRDYDKADRIGEATMWAQNIAAKDWRKACIEWLERRA